MSFRFICHVYYRLSRCKSVCYDTVIAMKCQDQFVQLVLEKEVLIRRDYSDFHPDD